MAEFNSPGYVQQLIDLDPRQALVEMQNHSDTYYSAQGKSVPLHVLFNIALLEKLLPVIPLSNLQPKP